MDQVMESKSRFALVEKHYKGETLKSADIKNKFFSKDKLILTISLISISVFALVLLVSGGIKGLFVLSDETAVVKAEIIDVVLGTMSIALILAAFAGIGLAYLLMYKEVKTKYINMLVLTVAGTLVISVLCVIFKAHEVYTGDWKDLNDLEKARMDTSVFYSKDGAKFANDVIKTKEDLIAMKVISDVTDVFEDQNGLNKLLGTDLLLSPIYNHSLLGTYLSDNTITAKDWFVDPNGLKAAFEKNTWNIKTINTLKDILGQPIKYTGLTNTYLQLYPVDLTFMIATVVAASLIPANMVFNKIKK